VIAQPVDDGGLYSLSRSPGLLRHMEVPPTETNPMLRHVIAAAVIIASSFQSLAADWPEFRGPTTQGRYEGPPLPTRWSETENVVWKQPIPGLGWSSPVIVGKRIYLTTAVPQGANHSLRTLCLDIDGGKTVWDKEMFVQEGKTAPRIHGKNSHASPTPIVRDGKIFVHFGHQGTACLWLDGKILWRNREQRYAPVHGNGGSPLLVDDLLIFSCDGASNPYVVALDIATGKQRWKTPRSVESTKSFAFCTPTLIDINGAKQVVLPCAGGVIAYEPKSGKEIWKVRYDGYSVIPRPVFGHGLVYLSTGYDTPQLLAIRVDGAGDVTDSHVAWRLSRTAPHSPSALLAGDELYIVSDRGIASCLDAKTGAVHWSERLPGAYSASPMLANGMVYFLNEEGTATVVKAEKTYQHVARSEVKERTLASFAAVDGALYLRTDKHLMRIEEKGRKD